MSFCSFLQRATLSETSNPGLFSFYETFNLSASSSWHTLAQFSSSPAPAPAPTCPTQKHNEGFAEIFALLWNSARVHCNINFIKYLYSGLCTRSILILWRISHSSLVGGNRAVLPQEAVINASFCLNRSLHFISTQKEQSHPLEENLSLTEFVCVKRALSNVSGWQVIMLMAWLF